MERAMSDSGPNHDNESSDDSKKEETSARNDEIIIEAKNFFEFHK